MALVAALEAPLSEPIKNETGGLISAGNTTADNRVRPGCV